MKYIRLLLLFAMLFALAESIQAQAIIGLTLRDTSVTYRQYIDVPVYVDSSTTGKSVIAYQLRMNYNATYLQAESVTTAGTMTEAAGMTVSFSAKSSQISIASAGTSATVGSGKLLYIRFKILQAGSTYLSFTDTLGNFFNQRNPRSKINRQSGLISIGAKPTINVSPQTGIVTVGETLQFSASAGVTPYSWSVSNPAVASISTTGNLTGLSRGLTKVIATDANGTVDSTDLFVEIRAFKVSIRDTSYRVGQIIDIPIRTSNLAGLGIFSGSLTIQYYGNYMKFIDIVTTGTLLAPATVFCKNRTISGTPQVNVVFGAGEQITGAGILFYMRMQLLNTGNVPLTPTNIIFNEDIVGNSSVGYTNITSLPVLTISPNGYGMTAVAGEKIQFSVSGGTAPYTWSSSDSNVGSISTTGNLTALKNGIITVTVQDSGGGISTSNAIQIYDTRFSILARNGLPGGFVNIPVTIGTLPAGKSISSLKLVITYNQSLIQGVGVQTTATTQTNNWLYQSKVKNGQMTVAGAGMAIIPNSDYTVPFVVLRFAISTTATLGSSTPLTIQSLLLDEGDPLAMEISGSAQFGATAVNLKVFLEGAYTSTNATMLNSLKTLGYLPTTDPYGSGISSTLPTLTVDWLKLEFRSFATGSTQATIPALLRTDGYVMTTTGTAPMTVDPEILPIGSYYIVVRHRNHLGIMSRNPVTLNAQSSSLYDFRSGLTQAYSFFGTPMKLLSSGWYGMIAGDESGDGVINALDRLDILNNSGATGYVPFDVTLDGVINAADRTTAWNNRFQMSQIP